MKILVTAGGTTEKIDEVRAITNHSTGRLGQAIAQAFLSNGHHVTYLTTPLAVRPVQTGTDGTLEVVEIETTAQLQQQIEHLLSAQTFEAIIHSMAVSDFSSETSLPEEALVQALTRALLKQDSFTEGRISEIIKETLDHLGQQQSTDKKISSNTERLLLFLKKNPKIIARIRQLQPSAILVGFKLLVGVSDDELIQVASNTLQQNGCDFVLANDLEGIHGDQHRGLLISQSGAIEEANTKQDIAQLILTQVQAKAAAR